MIVTKKDLIIINFLRNNAREKATELSKQIRVPVTTIYDRIRRIEERIVMKHTSIIDFSKLGYHLKSFVKISPNTPQMIAHLCSHKNINSLYNINYGNEIIAQTVFENVNSFKSFCKNLEEKFDADIIDISHVDEDIINEGFLSEGRR